MIIKNCLECNKEFQTKPSHEKRRKFCSYICYWKNKKGMIPNKKQLEGLKMGQGWNKNIPLTKEVKEKLSIFAKRRIGEKAAHWLGDKVGYAGLHYWIKKQLGQPPFCESCGKQSNNPKIIQWANRTGQYLRDINDWLRLCAKCHKLYDLSGQMEALLYK